MRLTNDIVGALEYEGRATGDNRWTAHYVWDEIPGFGVRVYPARDGKPSAKTFLLKYRNQYGKQRYYKIGSFPRVSASAARKEADRLREVIRKGGDPRHEQTEDRRGFDLDALADEFLEKYAKQRKKTWRKDEYRLNRHIRPVWGSKHPNEITRPAVAELHRTLAKNSGPVEANRTLALISKMFAWAIKHGFANGDNPAKGVEKYKEKSKDRWIQHDEMRWVLAAIEAEEVLHVFAEKKDAKQPPFPEGQFIKSYFLLILLTGARRAELLGLKWKDVHLGRKEATFRDTKNGKDHTVPLSAPAVDLLAALPQIDGNPYVFVGRVKGAPLRSPQKAWERIRDRAGELASAAKSPIDVSDVTIHDLRRTVGAWLATAGYSELLIGRVLNHSVRTVTGIYARVADEAVANALEAHAKQLEGVKGGK